jgi:hypothetical protein
MGNQSYGAVRFLKFETLLHFLKLLFEHKIRLVGIFGYRWVKGFMLLSKTNKVWWNR